MAVVVGGFKVQVAKTRIYISQMSKPFKMILELENVKFPHLWQVGIR